MVHLPGSEQLKETEILRIFNISHKQLRFGVKWGGGKPMVVTTKAVKTSYPRTKEVWLSFKVIVVAKFKVHREGKNLSDNHLLRNFFILAFLFSFQILCVSSLRGLMQTSEHAVLY